MKNETIAVLVWLAIMSLLAKFAFGEQPMFKQNELEFAQPQPYNNSLCIGDLIETNTGRLFRCGDVVRLKSNPEQLAVVFDYRWDGKSWNYILKAASYRRSKSP